MLVRKTLASLILASTVGLSGCAPAPSNYVEGRVVQEYGDAARLVESNVFLGESVKIGKLTYVLKVETPEGIYIIDVVQSLGGPYGKHTLFGLATAIEEGTRVRFPREHRGQNLFSSDNIGSVDPDLIEVLYE